MRSILHPSQLGIFEPGDLERIQPAFEEVLASAGIEKSSPEAADLAREILLLYRQGIHAPAKLKFMVAIRDDA